MSWLFGLTLFVSAALLFAAQPMIAKSLLPVWGGSPSVWNACMVFFQAMLLAGYTYAHATTAWFGARRQAWLHVVLLLLPWAFLPFAVQAPMTPASAPPVVRLLTHLCVTVGIPFFVVATTAPLLQRWFAEAAHLEARDPYPLYAASNFGSLIALLAYPLIIEPNLGLRRQEVVWAVGYAVLVVLAAVCAVVMRRGRRDDDDSLKSLRTTSEPGPSPPRPPTCVDLAQSPNPPRPKRTYNSPPWEGGVGGVESQRSYAADPAAPQPLSAGERFAVELHETDGERPPPLPQGGSYMDFAERSHALRFARWVALAFVPSSWLLGVTTYLTTDIAPVPLLWVVPLALYLLSFILVFARTSRLSYALGARALPLLAFPLALVLGLGLAQAFWLPLHLLTFFAGALVCHGALARDRPDPQRLTEFYLALALGGVLGGLFNALIAPSIFNRLTEYPLAVVLGCLALPRVSTKSFPLPRAWQTASRYSLWGLPLLIFGLIALLVRDAEGIAMTAAGALLELLASGLVVYVWYRHRRRPIRFALGMGAALLASGLSNGPGGQPLFRERNFYGTARVTAELTPLGEFHRLFHGNTLHGQQNFDPALRRDALAYFHRTGPIGQILMSPQVRPSVAIVGLGTGSLAAYAKHNERWTFYEIDPAVIRVAGDPRYFTFLGDCKASHVEVLEGDARLRLREATKHEFALIVLDVFSSDAIPTHLLTREAFALYRAKLAKGGLIAFHITNRYLDLEPVVGAGARDAGMVCRVRYDLTLTDEEKREGKQPSIWAVLATHEEDFGAIAHDPRWRPARVPSGTRSWSDDFSDPASHLVFRRGFRIARAPTVPQR